MKRKILCVCAAGNSRSAALAWRLKDPEFNCDALAIGAYVASPETLRMLCEWSETIVVMMEKFCPLIPKEFHNKTMICDVGEDRWVNPSHPELQKITYEWAKSNLTLKEPK